MVLRVENEYCTGRGHSGQSFTRNHTLQSVHTADAIRREQVDKFASCPHSLNENKDQKDKTPAIYPFLPFLGGALPLRTVSLAIPLTFLILVFLSLMDLRLSSVVRQSRVSDAGHRHNLPPLSGAQSDNARNDWLLQSLEPCNGREHSHRIPPLHLLRTLEKLWY